MNARRWQLAEPSADLVAKLSAQLGVTRLFASCLVNRGCTNGEAASVYLEPKLARLSDPFLLPNMEHAVDRLMRAHAAQERFAILAGALTRAGEDRRRLESAYREGRVDLEPYLAQRNRLVEAAEAEIDALAAIEEARSELARATGLTHSSLSAALGLGGGTR